MSPRSPMRHLDGLRNLWRYLRLDVHVLDGVEKHSGDALRILCVGRLEQSRYLLDSTLKSGYRDARKSRLGLWSLARYVQANSLDCDLSLVNIPPALCDLLGVKYRFAIPTWVVGQIDLRRFGSGRPNRSLASDLVQIRKNELEAEIVHSLEELDDFYHNMHVPLVRESHGSLAKVEPYESIRDRFGDCELLMIKKAGVSIAGGLIAYDGKHPRYWKLGIRPPLEEHLQQGAGAAAYQFALQRLASQGHGLVNIGRSRAMLNDGALQYKRKWGLQIRGVSSGWSLLCINKMNAATQAFLVQNPFIHSVRESLQAAVFVEDDASIDSRSLKKLSSRYHTDGLERSVLYRISGSGRTATAADGVQGSGELIEFSGQDITAYGQNPAARNLVQGSSARYVRQRLIASAEVLVDELFNLSSGESLLLCVDESSDPQVIDAIHEVAAKRNVLCDVVELKRAWNLNESARRIVDSVRSQASGAMCELTEKTYYQSRAWRDVIAEGTRIYSLAGLDAPSFVRCVGMVDHHRMYEEGLRYRKLLIEVRTIRIRSASGTDLTMSMRTGVGSWLARRLGGGRGTRVWQPTGLLSDTSRTSFLGGQLSFRPEEGSLDGTAVIDGYLWPPAECGKITEPVRWKFEKSRLVSIDGPANIERALRKHLGRQQALLEHLCLGYHPNAVMDESLIEAERVNGCINAGIGVGEHHTDGVMTGVHIEVDGEPLPGFCQRFESVGY